MDWVHFLVHCLYDFGQVIWSLNALVSIHVKEVIMLSLSARSFIYLDWKRLCFLLCLCVFCLFVFLEQLDSDLWQKFPGTAVKANNYLFLFRASGHHQQILNWHCRDLKELRSGTVNSEVDPRSHCMISPFHLNLWMTKLFLYICFPISGLFPLPASHLQSKDNG